MANFCGKCGTGIDNATGLCPNCDREKLNAVMNATVSANTANFCPYCGSITDKQTGICTNPSCNSGATNPYAAHTPQNTVDSKPKKKKSKALTTTVTVLLSICLFLTSLFAIVIYDVRNALKNDNAEKLLKNIQATDLLNSDTSDDDLERFYRHLSYLYGIEMDDYELNNFIEKSTVKGYMADKLSDFVKDFFKEEAELTITKTEVTNLLRKNLSVIRDEFDAPLTSSDVSEIADWIMGEDEIVIINTADLKEDSAALYYLLKIGLSYITMAIFIILSALIIFFMLKNSISQGFCGIGIDFIIYGALAVCVAILAAWITPLWKTICADSVIGIIIGKVMTANAVISIILLVSGIALLVIRNLISKRRAQKQNEML